MVVLTQRELFALGAHGVSKLRIDEGAWETLRDGPNGERSFALMFPSEDTKRMRKHGFVLLTVTGERVATHLARVRYKQKLTAFEHRVGFEVVAPIAYRELATEDPLGFAGYSLLPLSKGRGATLIAGIAARTENEMPLRLFLGDVSKPKTFASAVAMEVDALKLALEAFGGSRSHATVVAVQLSERQSALSTLRISEDNVIAQDARWIPGWELTDSDVTGRALFRSPSGDQLEVITANRQPLEKLFGVDLIYLNEQRGSLVMVQYKMLEQQTRGHEEDGFGQTEEPKGYLGGSDWVMRVDDQFRDELARMDRFASFNSPGGPYRLNPAPFYLKFVKRNGSTNDAGLIVSVEHFKQMETDGLLNGPRGGVRVSFRALDGHYLRGDAFVSLVQSGYIGTRGAATMHLRTLMEAALNAGRGVVAAIQSSFSTHDAR